MLPEISLGLALGYLGIFLSLLSTFMRSMQPLRVVAIVGNLFGVIYGGVEGVWPTFFGNLCLLPINGYRLWEIRKLAVAIEEAQRGQSIVELLLPHMRRSEAKAGTRLFSKGDNADVMYHLQSGQIHLIEIDKTLTAPTMLGEAGLFARDCRRALSADCVTDCVLYDLTREQLFALYFQNPQIGFNLMQVLVENMLDKRPSPPPVPAPPVSSIPATSKRA